VADAPRSDESPRPQAGRLAERVSDADRDRTVTQLREHVVEGRLTLDEFSERIGRALQATTRADLDAVMKDLPAGATSRPEQSGVPAPRKSRRWHVAVMSGHQTRGRWRIGGKTTAVAVMGGCDLDLRRAEIEGPEVEITAVAFWGGVQIIVPEGFDVELRGFSFMGGRSLRVRDVPIVPGSPRIVIRGFAVMGGVEVKSRSSRSGRDAAKAIAQGALGVADAFVGRAGTPGVGPGLEELDLHQIAREIRRQLKVERRGARSAPPPVPPMPPSPPTAWPGSPQTAPQSDPRPTPAPASQPTAEAAPRRVPEAAPERPEARAEPVITDGTVTILFCDMVDYAGMTERLGDHASRELLRDHHRIVRDALSAHGGREINVQGDGFMLAFPGVARALRCAMEIQRGFRDYVPPAEGEDLGVHIGINTGDAISEGDDYLGLTVIVASRLADAAGPGEILVSSLSEQLVASSGEFTFSGHRETRLKGMARAQLSATLAWT
jgi:class 3 adenylate cyclase